ncbi:YkgJ family cysteine cluster protein [Methylobacterium fujisawaense]
MTTAFSIDGPFDCQACGACCVAAGPVAVYPADDRVPRHRTRSVRRMIGFASYEADDGVRCMKADDDGSCDALKGQPGIAVSCGIYDRRPAVCADFQPGSDSCRDARRNASAHYGRIRPVPSQAGDTAIARRAAS